MAMRCNEREATRSIHDGAAVVSNDGSSTHVGRRSSMMQQGHRETGAQWLEPIANMIDLLHAYEVDLGEAIGHVSRDPIASIGVPVE
mgnify:FL=1